MKDLDLDKVRQTPLFFILGRPRTGSTLLRTLLDAHPQVCIPQEWPMLMALHRQFGKVSFWDKPQLQAFYRELFQKFRIPYWEITHWPQFDAAQMEQALLMCEGENSFETVFKVVYSQYHSAFAKSDIRLFGDKNPAYSMHAGQLARMFPDARFIHLTRDHRDQISSLLDVDFEIPNVAVLAYRWRYLWKKINKAAAGAPDRFYTLRYEDLVKRPAEELEKICHFLGIQFHEGTLEFHQHRDKISKPLPPGLLDRYFSSLLHPVDRSRTGIYQQKLSAWQVRIANQVVGHAADEAGYGRPSGRFDFAVYFWSLPAVAYAKGLYVLGYWVAFLPYRWMMWLLNKPSVVVSLYTRYKSFRVKK